MAIVVEGIIGLREQPQLIGLCWIPTHPVRCCARTLPQSQDERETSSASRTAPMAVCGCFCQHVVVALHSVTHLRALRPNAKAPGKSDRGADRYSGTSIEQQISAGPSDHLAATL